MAYEVAITENSCCNKNQHHPISTLYLMQHHIFSAIPYKTDKLSNNAEKNLLLIEFNHTTYQVTDIGK